MQTDIQTDQLDTLLGEFTLQLRAGENPSDEEYAARCPALSQSIRALFPTVRTMEALKRRRKSVLDEANTITPGERWRGDTHDAAATAGYSSSGHSTKELLELFHPAQSADEIGRLGAYRILKLLGNGGMGAVFAAEDIKLERRVALKVMKPEIAKKEQNRNRFLREARIASRVESDFICPIYQVGEENGVPFIAMPLLKGEPLDAPLKKNLRLAIDEIVRIGKEVAEGLSAAHEARLIHRDIKPGNIWLETQRSGPPRARILDFGLAHAQADDTQITQSGVIVGTPAYMSPEQARGEKNVDARTDLFSLGCVLYALCTGELPFQGETTMGILTALATRDPAPPRKLAPTTPQPLSDLIIHLLAKERDDRPQTAKQVIEELVRIEASLPKAARGGLSSTRSTPTSPIAASATKTQEWAPEATTSAPPRKKSLFAKIAAGVLGFALLLLGGVYHIVTDKGTIEIKTDDENVRVSILKNGQEIEILDGKSGKTWVLRTGTYTARLKDDPDGLEISLPDTFEMKRGGKHVVTIRKAQAPVAIGKGPAPAAADPDRKAADYVLSIGGVLRVNDQKVDINRAADLPNEALRLSYVGLWKAPVKDTDLALFKDCTSLSHLDLNATPVTDEGLAHLKNCNNLIHVNLTQTQVSDAGLAYFKDCKHLTYLSLWNTKVSDVGLAHLKDCKNLKRILLHGTKVSDAGLAFFKDCKDLSELSLEKTTIGETSIDRLSGFTTLTALNVKRTRLTEAGVKKLAAVLTKCKIDSDFGVFGPGAAADPDRPSLRDVLTSAAWEWTAPADLGAVVNFAPRNLAPTLSADGRNLVFFNGQESGLWEYRRDQPSTKPTRVQAPGMEGLDTFWDPCLSADGLTLYFLAKGPPTKDRVEVHATQRTAIDKPWSKVESVSERWKLDASPWAMRLSADGRVLIFTSSDLGGSGKSDLYMCRRDSAAVPFDPPVNLGPEINTADKEMVFALAADGCTLVFLRGEEPQELWLTSRPDTNAPFGPAVKVRIPTASFALNPAGLSGDGRTLIFTAPAQGYRLVMTSRVPTDPNRRAAADKQVHEVIARLIERNPQFDGKFTHKVEGGVVTELEFLTDNVTDLTPVQALTELRFLWCNGSGIGKGQLSDLTPLKDMKLTSLHFALTKVSDLSPLQGLKLTWLECSATPVSSLLPVKDLPLTKLFIRATKVSDLSPLQDMKLTELDCGATPVASLLPLKDMKLTVLICHKTRISDLSPLKDMPLTKVVCHSTKVTDLSPLQGSPLKEIECNFRQERDAEILRSIKTLETINLKPAAEFLK